MVISGKDVCCSVVFGTLVGVSVFSVMWSQLVVLHGHQCTSTREWSDDICMCVVNKHFELLGVCFQFRLC